MLETALNKNMELAFVWLDYIWSFTKNMILSINKNYNIKFELFSIACSTRQYFPVLVQLSWPNTVSLLGKNMLNEK